MPWLPVGTSGEPPNVVASSSRASASKPLATAIPSIPGSAIGPFLTQPLVVEAGGLDRAPTIVATEESRVIVGAGDIAYADRVGAAVTASTGRSSARALR